MSSESNGHKPDSQSPGPRRDSGSRRARARPRRGEPCGTRWRRVHNLEALLRSTSVLYQDHPRPASRAAAPAPAVLREAFERARARETRRSREVGATAACASATSSELLDATALADDERDDLADARAPRSPDELEARRICSALLERARRARCRPSVSLRPRGARGRPPRRRRARARGSRALRRATPDAIVDADPYVLGLAARRCWWRRVRDGGGADVVRPRARARAAGATSPSSRRSGPDDARLDRRSVARPAVGAARPRSRRAAWPQQIGAMLELERARAPCSACRRTG